MIDVNKIKKLIFFLGFSLVFSSYAYAVEFRGSAMERWDGVYTKKKAAEAMDAAKSKACLNAFNKYIQGMEQSKRMIFEGIEDQIYGNISLLNDDDV